jgi:hypothetical protein
MRFIPQIFIFVKYAKPNLDDMTLQQLDLAGTITNSTFYFIVFCFFCHIFVWTRLWHGPGEQSSSSMPLAQFPGQWGYPQGGGYMYVQNATGGQYLPAQGKPQNGQGPLEQNSLQQTHGQSPSSGQFTQYPLPQTQEVFGQEKESYD